MTNDSYYNASPECWAVYTEGLGAEYSHAVIFGQVHQWTVDTYAVQHAGGSHPDKSIDIHSGRPILRGPVDAADFKTYVFPLLFFKRICDAHDKYEAALAESERRRGIRSLPSALSIPTHGERQGALGGG